MTCTCTSVQYFLINVSQRKKLKSRIQEAEKKCEGMQVVIWETSTAVQLQELHPQSSGRGMQSQVQKSEKCHFKALF